MRSDLDLAAERYCSRALEPKRFAFTRPAHGEVAARQAARSGPLNSEHVGLVAKPLLRALQFQLRQRDVLAALGGLYFWFVPEKKSFPAGTFTAELFISSIRCSRDSM